MSELSFVFSRIGILMRTKIPIIKGGTFLGNEDILTGPHFVKGQFEGQDVELCLG